MVYLQAAFGNNTLGLPKLCPRDNIPLIGQSTLFHYLHNYHTPERMVLAGVGVDHEQLVEHAHKYFGNIKPTWERPEVIAMGNKVDGSLAQYTGGIKVVSYKKRTFCRAHTSFM